MRPFRIWPPLVLIILLFALRSLPAVIKDAPDWLWMVAVFGPLICCLFILVWWLAASRASWREKLLGLGGIAIAALITVAGLHSTMKGPGMLTLTIPMGIVGFGGAAILLSRWLHNRRIVAIVATCLLGFGFSLLLRNEGMWGNGEQAFRWRWTKTAEQKMLASKETLPSPVAPLNSTSVTKADWPGFRGPNRDGRVIGGSPFSSDWSTTPPKELWRIALGPGWSSFSVGGDKIYTQEQRGPDEYIVCYSADTGQEIWTSLAGGRFDDPMGGPGPRATPELSEGKLYGLTAQGILVCVDSGNGTLEWKVDISQIANQKPPMWGFSSSPLITDSLVVVHAGGDGDRGTLAFNRETGDLAWSAPAGDHSYSSPQRSSLLGEDFIMMSTNKGLRLLDPATGEVKFFHDSNYRGYRTLQPQLLGNDSVLVQASGGPGTYRLALSKSGEKIEGKEVWKTNWLKSDFNGCVIHNGYIYGFNGSVLTCLDIETGERKWRGGKYGKGQVLLLENSDLLLVISERGQAVLVKATPEGHKELASLQLFKGKAWSHPVVVKDRLFIRNASEAVCFRLPVLEIAKR